MSLKNQPGNPKVQAVIDLLRREYPEASIETVSFDGDIYDLIIEREMAVYLVGIKLARATMKTVAKLSLYAKAVSQRFEERRVIVRLYAPTIAPDAKTALDRSGGVFQKLPTAKPKGMAADSIKLTSPGSWKVICHFIKHEEATMNQASVQTGVSYPWTRAVIRKLLNIGAFKDEGKKVRLSSMDQLFDYVVWERPINNLRSLEFRSAYHDEQEALYELYRNVSGIIPQSACALFTAADLYLEGIASGGCIQLYADENAALVVKSLLGEGDGVSFQIYSPDREMDIATIEDIRVVSPEQTILDLAGLGTYGAESAKIIAEYYKRSHPSTTEK
ncbi:MAG TPA: hypothetical protein VK436_08735 [Methanocella sp.]|nr:hypothetical protein [Methanocella sp.]